MMLPGHNGLIISEVCLVKNFVNSSFVEVREFHPTFFRADYHSSMLGLTLI